MSVVKLTVFEKIEKESENNFLFIIFQFQKLYDDNII